MSITALESLWRAYTAQMLDWTLGPAPIRPTQIQPIEAHTQSAAACMRLARMHLASGRRHCILLGAGDGHLATALRTALPPEHGLWVLEGDIATARAVSVPCAALPKTCILLADTSPLALLLLSASVLHSHSSTLAWTLPAPQRAEAPGTPVLEKWRHMFTTVRHERLAAPAPLRLVVGCILHPDEQYLEDFFAQIPAWVQGLAVVWDGRPPASLPVCRVPVYSAVRPLDGDFAAQRNVMLDLCRAKGDWCLYLDADERLSADVWESLPRLTAHDNTGGVYFPRLTFEGDTAHARMGYGLWPDVQLRLFALTQADAPYFVGRVHETLHGLQKNIVLAPSMCIHHYSHIHKDREALRARLAVFDTAAGTPTHVLSNEYPRLPTALLCQAGEAFGMGTVLRL